jgi:hypothetical protein
MLMDEKDNRLTVNEKTDNLSQEIQGIKIARRKFYKCKLSI